MLLTTSPHSNDMNSIYIIEEIGFGRHTQLLTDNHILNIRIKKCWQ